MQRDLRIPTGHKSVTLVPRWTDTAGAQTASYAGAIRSPLVQ